MSDTIQGARPAERESELVWYSRAAVLGGSLILIVEAVTQRSQAVITVLAVIGVFFGLLLLVAGLIIGGRQGNAALPAAEPGATLTDVVPDPPVTGENVPSPGTDAEQAALAESVPPASLAVRTFRIDDALHNACIACKQPLSRGQIAAVCPVCRRPQHASCWIDNDFSCSDAACSGAGNLQAPSGGPSKP